MKNERMGKEKSTVCKVSPSFVILAKDFFHSSDICPELNLYISQLLPLKRVWVTMKVNICLT